MLLSKIRTAFASRAAVGAIDATSHPHKIAAIALILRDNSIKNRTEMLFIKRSISERDVWSGDIAFPGGCHDTGDGSCGMDTVCREVNEETGLDLKNEKRYIRIGTLPERTVPRGRKHLTIVPFIFIDNAPVFTNEYVINGKEISCLWWEDVDDIDQNFLGIRDRFEIDIEKRFLTRFLRKPVYYYVTKGIIKSLSLSCCSFPCISLSPHNNRKDTTTTTGLYFPAGTPPLDFSDDSAHFALWGLTMSVFNEVMFIATEKKNPYLNVKIKFDNALFNFHFHMWQWANISWRNSLVLGTISYLSSILTFVYGMSKILYNYMQ